MDKAGLGAGEAVEDDEEDEEEEEDEEDGAGVDVTDKSRDISLDSGWSWSADDELG